MAGTISVVDALYNEPYIQFVGDTSVSGGLVVSSSVTAREFSGSFSGSGRDLFDIPFSNLTGDASRIASGSATASVAPDTGLLVNTGATIADFLIVSGASYLTEVSASSFSGSGANLFDIPFSALTGDSPRIASGSVTASIAPNTGLVVNTKTTVSGNLLVSSSGEAYAEDELSRFFYITYDGDNNNNIFSGSVDHR